MTHLVFGASGMLGLQLLRELRARGHRVEGASRHGPDHVVDVCSGEETASLIRRAAPAVVWNAAAIVNLALCERDPAAAYAVNARAVCVMAQACRETGARFVQVSTDHYYVGHGALRHDEQAEVNLVNEYARTKFAGEAFALTNRDALVLRTNITGFRGAASQPTFAEWGFYSVLGDRPVTLFDDMHASTLDARSFCKAACDLLESGATGIVNVASGDVATKKVFIETLAQRLGRTLSKASAGSVRGLEPQRADSLGLDVCRAETLLGYRLPGLTAVVDALIAEYKGPK